MLLPFKKGQGLMRDIMITTLKTLRANESVLLATLSTFIREPTMDWLSFANTSAARNDQISDFLWSQKYALSKIEIVKKKLKGVHPCDIAIEEFIQGQGKIFPKIMQIKDLLLGEEGSIRRRLKNMDNSKLTTYLGVDEICDCLLEWSSDDRILVTSYRGWSPWI